jgi:hypothetical protein
MLRAKYRLLVDDAQSSAGLIEDIGHDSDMSRLDDRPYSTRDEVAVLHERGEKQCAAAAVLSSNGPTSTKNVSA